MIRSCQKLCPHITQSGLTTWQLAAIDESFVIRPYSFASPAFTGYALKCDVTYYLVTNYHMEIVLSIVLCNDITTLFRSY